MGIAKHRSAVVMVGLLASAVFMYLAVRRLDLAALKVVWASVPCCTSIVVPALRLEPALSIRKVPRQRAFS